MLPMKASRTRWPTFGIVDSGLRGQPIDCGMTATLSKSATSGRGQSRRIRPKDRPGVLLHQWIKCNVREQPCCETWPYLKTDAAEQYETRTSLLVWNVGIDFRWPETRAKIGPIYLLRASAPRWYQPVERTIAGRFEHPV